MRAPVPSLESAVKGFQGLWFRFEGSGFGVSGEECGVSGTEFGVSFECRVLGFGCRDSGSGFWVSGSVVKGRVGKRETCVGRASPFDSSPLFWSLWLPTLQKTMPQNQRDREVPRS